MGQRGGWFEDEQIDRERVFCGTIGSGRRRFAGPAATSAWLRLQILANAKIVLKQELEDDTHRNLSQFLEISPDGEFASLNEKELRFAAKLLTDLIRSVAQDFGVYRYKPNERIQQRIQERN